MRLLISGLAMIVMLTDGMTYIRSPWAHDGSRLLFRCNTAGVIEAAFEHPSSRPLWWTVSINPHLDGAMPLRCEP